MAYSKSYQEIEAGRCREDETSFYGLNKVATPARVTTFVNLGGKKQPTIEVNHLQYTGVGKPNNPVDPVTGFTSDNLSTNNENSVQNS
jgi:hypothetical protein